MPLLGIMATPSAGGGLKFKSALDYLQMMARRGTTRHTLPPNLFSVCHKMPLGGVGLVFFREEWMADAYGDNPKMTRGYHLTKTRLRQDTRKGRAFGFEVRDGETSDVPVKACPTLCLSPALPLVEARASV